MSFARRDGQITAVLGANGAGKTTLLRTISGLKAPRPARSPGRRSLVGMQTEDIARSGVGHVPEGRGVIGEFTVEENLRLGAMTAKVHLKTGLEDQFELFPVLGERRKPARGEALGWRAPDARDGARPHRQAPVLLLDEPRSASRRS